MPAVDVPDERTPRRANHEPPRLGIVVSHPIQYQAPLYQLLARRGDIEPQVLFLSQHGLHSTFDPGFGVPIAFDVPLTDGYRHCFLRNISPVPSVERPFGLINPGVVTAIRRGGFDAVLVHGYAHVSNWLAVLACRAAGVPYLLRGESRIDEEHRLTAPRRLLKRALIRPLVRGASASLSIGARNRDFYLAYGAEPDRIFPAPYSIDNDRFAAASALTETDRSDLRRQLDIPVDVPVVLFVGKLQAWKRPFDAVEAVAAMQRRVVLVVVGDGPLRPELEALASERVRILGFVNQAELPRWYGLADVVVLPSAREPWGLVVNEAMASGCVPVVSDAVGAAEDLVTREVGRTHPVGDVRALAAALDDVLEESQLRRMQAAAREKVRDHGLDVTAGGIVAAVRAVSRG